MLNYEYPPLGGGAGRISQNISEQLVLLGHHVTVVTTWFNNLPETENNQNKPTIIRIKSRRKKQYQSNVIEMLDWMIKSWYFLKNYLTQQSFDLCFANFTLPGGWVAYKIQQKFNIPYVIISHGHDIPWFYKKQMFIYHLFTYFTIKKIANKAKYLFVQSRYMKTNAEKFLGKKKAKNIILIPNGINFKNIDFKARCNNIFTILFVGRLVKQKNPLTFIKALKILSTMQIPYHAYIIGEGKLRTKIEKLIVRYGLNHVKLCGWISNDEVWQYYEKAHVMVMPSEIEGMSISNLEAISAGLYLIATPTSGNPDIIENCKNGELVPFNSAKEIANALQKFYFDKYINKKFTDTQEIKEFCNKFSWQNIVKQYEIYLNKIITQNED